MRFDGVGEFWWSLSPPLSLVLSTPLLGLGSVRNLPRSSMTLLVSALSTVRCPRDCAKSLSSEKACSLHRSQDKIVSLKSSLPDQIIIYHPYPIYKVKTRGISSETEKKIQISRAKYHAYHTISPLTSISAAPWVTAFAGWDGDKEVVEGRPSDVG